MAIYLVRHGETPWNVEKRFQGRMDIELNENGIRQAETAGEALKSVVFEASVSSPLKRAFRTAQIICQKQGSVEVKTDSRLVERGFGALEGMREPEALAWMKNNGDPGIETIDASGERMLAALLEIAAEYGDRDVLVASHGSSICCLLYKASGGRLSLSGYQIPNGGISKLTLEKDGTLKVRLYAVEPMNFRPDMPDMPIPENAEPFKGLV